MEVAHLYHMFHQFQPFFLFLEHGSGSCSFLLCAGFSNFFWVAWMTATVGGQVPTPVAMVPLHCNSWGIFRTPWVARSCPAPHPTTPANPHPHGWKTIVTFGMGPWEENQQFQGGIPLLNHLMWWCYCSILPQREVGFGLQGLHIFRRHLPQKSPAENK